VKAKDLLLAFSLIMLFCMPAFTAEQPAGQAPAAITGEQNGQLPAQATEEKIGEVSAPPATGETGQSAAPPEATRESGPPVGSSEQYKFEASEYEKKPYRIGGFAEVRPVLDGLNKGGALYKTNFYNQHEPGQLGEFNSRIQMDGSLQKGMATLFARGNFSANDNVQGWSRIGTLYEGYLTLKPSDSWIFDTGKKTFKWGKGYAWNPAGQ